MGFRGCAGLGCLLGYAGANPTYNLHLVLDSGLYRAVIRYTSLEALWVIFCRGFVLVSDPCCLVTAGWISGLSPIGAGDLSSCLLF